MKICDILKEKFTISFEFFPPKTREGEENLFNTINDLLTFNKDFNPDFVSITFGAGGTTKDKTFEITKKIKDKYNLTILEHFTCYGLSKKDIETYLKRIKDIGIENILALRGDKPRNIEDFVPPPDTLNYASELVEFIKNIDKSFCIGVAGYPEGHPKAPSLEKDIEYLKLKLDKGASFVITQLFFDNNDFYRYIELVRKKGIEAPIIPGILPIISWTNLERFTQLSGAKLPQKIYEDLYPHKDDKDYIIKYGIEFSIKQIEDLIEFGIPGIHIFTLNKSYSSKMILKEILKKI